MLEKIDIIGLQIFTYDENFNAIKTLPLTSEYNAFIKEFSDKQDMLTVNISKPIKRIMKYYDTEKVVDNTFIELDYNDMDNSQKLITDNFINKVNSNL
jgi:hypothetical protein